MQNVASIRKKTLKQIVSACSALVDECKITVSNEGWNVKVVDPAHVSMLDMTIPKRSFDQYSVNLEESTTEFTDPFWSLTGKYQDMLRQIHYSMHGISFIAPEKGITTQGDNSFGINLDKMMVILKKGRDDDLIKIVVDTDTDKIEIGYPLDKKGTYGTVESKLVNTDGMSAPKVPNIVLPSSFMIDTESFISGINATSEYSDHIALVGNSDGLTIFSEGDTNKFHVDYPKDKLIYCQSSERVRSLFPNDYFTNILKGIKTLENVTIALGNDLPIKFMNDENGIITIFLLAPRIEND